MGRHARKADGVNDTIFAVASGPPPAAIAIIRISGPRALAAAGGLAGSLPRPRQAGLRALRDPGGLLLDRALVLVTPGPRSSTGEDVVELHLHGGRAVVASVMSVLADHPELRLAEPGEFTRRALTNGLIDLAQAEGLGDLLAAETETQRRAAIGAAEGAVGRAVGAWNVWLLQLAARVEAQLDFADEDDVASADGAVDRVRINIAHLAGDIRSALAAPTVTRLRDGVRVVLAGPPNSGKSTLFNVLVGRDAAIVSPIAGTTRDVIEAPIIRSGIAFVFADTAGLATTTHDPIERIGIERAGALIDGADILLWLGDTHPPRDSLWIYPRADVRPSTGDERLAVSAATGAGIGVLWDKIVDQASGLLPREDQLALNQRQHDLCAACVSALDRAAESGDLLIVAEELRTARAALDRITGKSGVEAMLDALFGQFCIGK